MKTYFRPLGLVYGPDARALIVSGRAGALGGMGHVGFTLVEVVERPGTRSVVPYSDVKHEPVVQQACALRPSFGGVAMDATRIMGIVNVTPDSFSDGGRLADDMAAVAHGQALKTAGADILDVGGESTRPGSDDVSVDEELRRVTPVIAGLAKHAVVSVDTRNSVVMAAALQKGAVMINDVSALGHDAASAALVAKAKCAVVLMHAQGAPKTMQLNPKYDDVLLDVYDGLEARVVAAEVAGIARERICVDPGIGFGKTFSQNLQLMAGLSLFHGLGLPVLAGLSRKGFVGAVTGEMPAAARVSGSVGGALAAAGQAVHILRVHDVKETRAALSMFTASVDPDSADI
jgi:dihydropteroate synthase